MDVIINKPVSRVQVIAYTQYGKSTCVGCALMFCASTLNERWAIVAPNAEKAGIIMQHVVQHVFDSPLFWKQLIFDTSLEKLKQERSRTRLTFKGGGEVRIFSADTRNRKQVTKSMTGFGAPNVIIDESSLVPDTFHGMIRRMVRGTSPNFILEIGNPFERHHFLRTWTGNRYHKIFIDHWVGLIEGRITEDDLREAQEDAFYDVLYECMFPEEDAFLDGGYQRLFPLAMLETSMVKPGTVEPEGRPRLGGDFAGGGVDLSAYMARWDNIQRLLETNTLEDTMQQVPIVKRLQEALSIDDRDLNLDYGGLGQGPVDRLKELGINANAVKFGGSSSDPKQYKNIRAEMYWQYRQWLMNGGKIESHDELKEQLHEILFKEDSAGKLQIEPKDKMKERLAAAGKRAKSPDLADSGALTFAPAKPGPGNILGFYKQQQADNNDESDDDTIESV